MYKLCNIIVSILPYVRNSCYGIGQASHLKLPNSIPMILFLMVSASNAQTDLNCYIYSATSVTVHRCEL